MNVSISNNRLGDPYKLKIDSTEISIEKKDGNAFYGFYEKPDLTIPLSSKYADEKNLIKCVNQLFEDIDQNIQQVLTIRLPANALKAEKLLKNNLFFEIHCKDVDLTPDKKQKLAKLLFKKMIKHMKNGSGINRFSIKCAQEKDVRYYQDAMKYRYEKLQLQ